MRFFRVLLLAFALLFVQHGAQTHALSHLAGSTQDDQHAGHAKDCEKCVAYAGIGNAVATHSFGLASVTPASERLQWLTAAQDVRAYAYYRTRAPPSSL